MLASNISKYHQVQYLRHSTQLGRKHVFDYYVSILIKTYLHNKLDWLGTSG